MPRPRSFQVYARYIAQPLGVVITAPPDGGTATSAAVEIEWVVGGGLQASYIVRVYSDAALTTLVYSSGSVASPTPSHTIPVGVLLSGFTYYVTVEVTFTEAGGTAISEASSFTTAFPASGNVGTVTTRAIGGCTSDQRALPGIRVSWNAPTLGVGETFVQYDVRRRVAGATMWTTIASLTTETVLSYIDYGVASQEVYEYSVLYQATVSGGIVVSATQSPAPTGWVKFDFAFIHAVGEPATYVRFDGWQVDFDVKMNVQYQEVWGRQAPVAQVGEQDYRTATLQGHPEQLARLRIFPATRALVTAQRASSRVLCLRLGRARDLMYGQINGLKRTGGGGSVGGGGPSKTAYSTLNMTETFFDEAAAAATIQPPVVVPATSGTANLTLSGDLVTDAVRALAEWGDGLPSPQSKVGFFGATQNRITNGGFETDAAGWTAVVPVVRSTAQAKFGSASGLVTSSAVSAYAAWFNLAIGAPLVQGRRLSSSIWVLGSGVTIGKTLVLDLVEAGGASGDQALAGAEAQDSLVLSAEWQEMRVTGTIVQADRTTTYLVLSWAAAGAGEIVHIDGANGNDGYPVPYIETDGGPATAVIGAASGPTSLASVQQGWFAGRFEMGYASTDTLGYSPVYFSIPVDNDNWILVYRSDGTGDITLGSSVGGVAEGPAATAIWANGGEITIVARWTATTLSISLNGSAFVTIPRTLVGADPASFYIGAVGDGFWNASATANAYWVALGTGTLGDTRPATFDAWGNTDRPDPLQYWFAPEEELTVFWPADTAAYRYPVPS